MLPATMLGDRISRQDLVRSPHVWFALCATFGLFAVSIAILAALGWPREASSTRLSVLAAALGVVSVVLVRSNAPEPDTARAHLLLALVYVGPAFALWGFQPVGSAAIASAMFVGPLVAMWSTRIRDVVLHLSAATLALTVPCVMGWANAETVTAVIALVPATWVLAACVAMVFSASEQQGEQLAHLIRRDPLTGAGNRRLLAERLEFELGLHRTRRQPLSLLTFDLNGFKALNDRYGHAAGDRLLIAVAHAIKSVVRERDVVVRQGGDEFCVLLPETSGTAAADVGDAIRCSLARIDAGVRRGAVSTGLGIATFPSDGDDAEALLAAADATLRSDKLRPVAFVASPTDEVTASDTSRAADDERIRDAGVADAAEDAEDTEPSRSAEDRAGRWGAVGDGVGRVELQHHRGVWQAHAWMYLIYAALGSSTLVLFPSVAGSGLPYVIAFGALIGVVYLVTGPPTIGTRINHAVVVMTYLVPFLILLTCAPGGSMAVGCLVFVGPLAAVRLVDRRHIGAHYLAATVLLGSLIVAGAPSLPTTLAILILIGVMWVLGACCVVMLEGAEAQAAELRRMVRRDALTGAANRRALDEQLSALLDGRAPSAPVSVIALDLNGFKALNDTHGHAAGDALLVEVAGVLMRDAGDGDLVVRQGGDEFCVVLDGVDADGAARRVAEILDALGKLDAGGAPLSSGAGSATFPEDGSYPQGLLDVADQRLVASKAGTRRSPKPSLDSAFRASA